VNTPLGFRRASIIPTRRPGRSARAQEYGRLVLFPSKDALTSSMTPIRIDRTLQSTILFSKMSTCRLGSLRVRRANDVPAVFGSRRTPALAGPRARWGVVFPTASFGRTSDASSPRGPRKIPAVLAAVSPGIGPRTCALRRGRDPGTNPSASGHRDESHESTRRSAPEASFPSSPRHARSTTGPDDPESLRERR
jgi:hypothetical protein